MPTTKLTISDKVNKIEEKAFEKYEKLTTIIIGKDVKEIGKEAFINCPSINEIKYEGENVSCGNNVFDAE